MTSLLPKSIGTGSRRNAGKRAFILNSIDGLEYRTLPSASVMEARRCERELKAKKSNFGRKTH